MSERCPRVDLYPKTVPVLFKSDRNLRYFILNRPDKLNSLNDEVLDLLRGQLEEWIQADTQSILVGTGVGRAFCSGGDVESVRAYAYRRETLPMAINFFRKQFEIDYILATIPMAYIAVMDGITMGGGAGLSASAPFRIATENTVFATPETRIGYCTDAGMNFFLSRIDGELGTYLALTSQSLQGRAVFEHGFATHFVPSHDLPALLERLAALERPSHAQINALIEAYHPASGATPGSPLAGAVRVALDAAFRHDTVEAIVAELDALATGGVDGAVRKWAARTRDTLMVRSPTGLKVTLAALRRARALSFADALQTDLNLATAFSLGASPDFTTGVDTIIVRKEKATPAWSPRTLGDVSDAWVARTFFAEYAPERGTVPRLAVPPYARRMLDPMTHTLPAESEIRAVVEGRHEHSVRRTVGLEELVELCAEMKGGKMGVREKVVEVVQRKCEVRKDAGSGREWLVWKGE
ncbi:uncharacterized protein FIBRA_02595 [Fibroporia radiculosa]|uniref:3-hydroxyisobutyryl-CoA hydrolase n=1 Tax=Fibroporia radiculosa TaxID=599839 RepID=J4I953_9APHY|nr:uncharacterized protein FIBRA_02595 [Fibroporia radiculosa]CCM00561.1 predicted protein [Fibroporia radiculosa]